MDFDKIHKSLYIACIKASLATGDDYKDLFLYSRKYKKIQNNEVVQHIKKVA